MRIQGKRVWIAGQFMAAQMEIEDGAVSMSMVRDRLTKITGIRESCRASLTSIHTEHMILTQTTASRKGSATG